MRGIDLSGIECGEGWMEILLDFVRDCGNEDVQITQIKEKFGRLRIYANTTSPRIRELIKEAELKSHTTCEICGQPGKLISDNGWLKTRCEKHEEK